MTRTTLGLTGDDESLVFIRSDEDQLQYYALSLSSGQPPAWLAAMRPSIASEDFNTQAVIEITASDGLVMPTILTLPARGYLVVQPQFRGSSVFGKEHLKAEYGEWGRKMQQDLTDSLAFLVEEGLSDPERVCIVGASYGGYAALAGAAFAPDLYQCALWIAGVSHLPDMLKKDKSRYGRYYEV